jgi:hypothetical protein
LIGAYDDATHLLALDRDPPPLLLRRFRLFVVWVVVAFGIDVAIALGFLVALCGTVRIVLGASSSNILFFPELMRVLGRIPTISSEIGGMILVDGFSIHSSSSVGHIM